MMVNLGSHDFGDKINDSQLLMFDLSLIGTEHRVAITLIEDNISFLSSTKCTK